MAAIEKVCECSNDSCEYHGGEMYNFKLNSLQINPECRSKYKGLTAKVYIINPHHLSSEWYDAYSLWGDSYGRMYKNNDVFFDGVLYNEEQYRLRRKPYKHYRLVPVRKVFKLEVMVIVEETNEVFYNSIWDVRKFKLNMINMFGKQVSYKRISKKVCCDFKNSYDLFDKYRPEESGNNGFTNMVDYVANSVIGIKE